MKKSRNKSIVFGFIIGLLIFMINAGVGYIVSARRDNAYAETHSVVTSEDAQTLNEGLDAQLLNDGLIVNE